MGGSSPLLQQVWLCGGGSRGGGSTVGGEVLGDQEAAEDVRDGEGGLFQMRWGRGVGASKTRGRACHNT